MRFQAKPFRGAENDIHLPGWPDAHGAKRLIAPAKEQLALIAENGLHGFLSLRVKIGGWCRDRTHAARRLTRFSGPGHYFSANHPCKLACRAVAARRRLAARLGLAPRSLQTATSGLTGRRATLTPPGNGTAGRILACVNPLRRRMPDMFSHGSVEMVGMAGFSPAASRSQAGCSKD